VDGQCDKLVMIVGHQSVYHTDCVQHGGREAPRRAGLSVAVETCLLFKFSPMINVIFVCSTVCTVTTLLIICSVSHFGIPLQSAKLLER